MADAVEKADLPGAKDSAEALRRSVDRYKDSDSATLEDAEDGCTDAMGALVESAMDYEALIEFPDECRSKSR